jgi:hypothetical protein
MLFHRIRTCTSVWYVGRNVGSMESLSEYDIETQKANRNRKYLNPIQSLLLCAEMSHRGK